MFDQSQGSYGSAINVNFLENMLLRNSLITTSFCIGVAFGHCSCLGVINSTFTNATNPSLLIFDHAGYAACAGLILFGNGMFNRNRISNTEADTALINDWLSQSPVQIGIAIWNCSFTNHRLPTLSFSSISEAALRIDAGVEVSVLLADVLFDNNVGAFGAAFTHTFSFRTIIWNCMFSNNVASHSGAALVAERSRLNGGFLIGNTTMVNNTALRGGAMYGDSTIAFQIVNSTFAYNTAFALGGALYCDRCRLLRLWKSVVKGNLAAQGGAGIYCDTCLQVSVTDTQLLSNRCASESERFVSSCIMGFQQIYIQCECKDVTGLGSAA